MPSQCVSNPQHFGDTTTASKVCAGPSFRSGMILGAGGGELDWTSFLFGSFIACLLRTLRVFCIFAFAHSNSKLFLLSALAFRILRLRRNCFAFRADPLATFGGFRHGAKKRENPYSRE